MIPLSEHRQRDTVHRTPMTAPLSEIHMALAVAPFTALMAVRELWSRRRMRQHLRAREQEAERMRSEAMRAMHEAIIAERAAQRSRAEFLARMSHELRTPLNAVIGFTRVLEKNGAGNQRPEDVQMLGRVRAGGEQLLRMVEDVLDQSRIEKGQLTLTYDKVDVALIARSVVSSYRSAAVAKGLRMLAVLPESAALVSLDGGRFEQVLRHLVDNAVKFTGAGSIKITLVTDASSGRPTRLSVADSGIGIPADRLERIFIPFEQIDGVTRRSHGGAGLGLPLSRQLCEAMGCQLTVESTHGSGSRFTIRFPGA